MGMADILVTVLILAILGSIALFLRAQKKKGIKCIGCPNTGSCSSGGCSGKCAGCSGQCRK